MRYLAPIYMLVWAFYFNRNDSNYAGALLGTVGSGLAALGTAYLLFGKIGRVTVGHALVLKCRLARCRPCRLLEGARLARPLPPHGRRRFRV
jgi:hypothetical protein